MSFETVAKILFSKLEVAFGCQLKDHSVFNVKCQILLHKVKYYENVFNI